MRRPSRWRSQWAPCSHPQQRSRPTARLRGFLPDRREKSVAVIDNPPEGKSIGDVRAGWRKLVDFRRPVGEVHFVATRRDRKRTAAATSWRRSIHRAEGRLDRHESLYELPNAADTASARQCGAVVTGGTGPFAGAGGTVAIEAGDPPTYVFDLHCAK